MNTEEKGPELEADDAEITSEIIVVPKKSKGQLFKEQHGYSKTLKRNMKKRGISSPADYKAIRKQNKAAQAKAKRDKHAKAVAGRKTKSAISKK